MFKFYSVTFTNRLGKELEVFVLGTQDQANDWAVKEASANGFTYDVKYLCTDNLTGTVKNLCNY